MHEDRPHQGVRLIELRRCCPFRSQYARDEARRVAINMAAKPELLSDRSIRSASDQRRRPSPDGRPFTFKMALFTTASVAVDDCQPFHTILIVSRRMRFVFFVGVVYEVDASGIAARSCRISQGPSRSFKVPDSFPRTPHRRFLIRTVTLSPIPVAVPILRILMRSV